jgi:hypothetical protein
MPHDAGLHLYSPNLRHERNTPSERSKSVQTVESLMSLCWAHSSLFPCSRVW